MKLRTIDDLAAYLDTDLAWRRKEISTLAFSIKSASESDQEILCRAGFAMLYAHYEGYIKNSCQAYLEYVAGRKLKYQQLIDPFWAICFGQRLSKQVSPATSDVQSLLHEIRNCDHTLPTIPTKNVVVTKSNLSSKRFQRIMLTLGLDDAHYSSKYVYIDKTLLHIRNNVAHGHDLVVTVSDFSQACTVVRDFIETISVQIFDAASSGSYRIP